MSFENDFQNNENLGLQDKSVKGVKGEGGSK